MPIVVFYKPENLTAAQYNAVVAEIETHMSFPWDGLLNTVCYGEGNMLKVIDVWESQAKFDKFCELLVPMVERHGIKMGAPEVVCAYSSMEGRTLKRFESVTA